MWTDLAIQIWKLHKRKRTAAMAQLRKAQAVQADEVLKLVISKFSDRAGKLVPSGLVYGLHFLSKAGLDRQVLALAEIALCSGYVEIEEDIHSALIRNYAHNGQEQVAIQLLESLPQGMQHRRQVHHIFSGLFFAKRAQEAMEFLAACAAKPHFQGDVKLFENAVVAAPELVVPIWRLCLSQGTTPSAKLVLEITKACVRQHLGLEAAEAIEQAVTRGVQLDNATYNYAFSALRKDRRSDRASQACLEVLEHFLNHVKPRQASQPLYHSAIAAGMAFGHVDVVEQILNNMHQAKLRYDALTLNSLCIPQRGKADKLSQSKLFDLIKRVMNEGAQPDVATMESVLDSCRRSNSLELGLQFFELLSSAGIKPSLTALNFLIDLFISNDQLEPAKKCFEELLQDGMKPDRWTYSAMIKGYVRANQVAEAERLLNEAIENMVFSVDVALTGKGRQRGELNLDKLSQEASELIVDRLIASMQKLHPAQQFPITISIHATGKPHFTDANLIYQKLQLDESLEVKLVKLSAVQHTIHLEFL